MIFFALPLPQLMQQQAALMASVAQGGYLNPMAAFAAAQMQQMAALNMNGLAAAPMTPTSGKWAGTNTGPGLAGKQLDPHRYLLSGQCWLPMDHPGSRAHSVWAQCRPYPWAVCLKGVLVPEDPWEDGVWTPDVCDMISEW